MFGWNDVIENNLFRFLVRLSSKESLVTTMMEKEVEGVNRYVRIFLISIIMLVIWFTIQDVIQLTLNYQIHDLLMGVYVLSLCTCFMLNLDYDKFCEENVGISFEMSNSTYDVVITNFLLFTVKQKKGR